MTLYARLAVLAVILAVLAGGAWKSYVMGKKTVQAEWAIEREAANEQAREARELNRASGLKAEVKYVERERVRVETVREILTEVNNETQNLATCTLDAGDISVLNAAANRLREDRPAAVGSDNRLRDTGKTD